MHDHFTPEEHEVFGAHHGCMRQGCEDEAHTTFGKPHGHACLGRGRCALVHSASYEEAVISMSQKLYGQTYEFECSDNRIRFRHKISGGFLYSHRHLLRTHFGVDLWITTSHAHFDWLSNKVARAFLTLPCSSSQQDPRSNNPVRRSAHGTPSQRRPTLSPASLKKFSRALKRLGLELFNYPGQTSLRVQHPLQLETPTVTAAEQPGSWPQLVKLLRDLWG